MGGIKGNARDTRSLDCSSLRGPFLKSSCVVESA